MCENFFEKINKEANDRQKINLQAQLQKELNKLKADGEILLANKDKHSKGLLEYSLHQLKEMKLKAKMCEAFLGETNNNLPEDLK